MFAKNYALELYSFSDQSFTIEVELHLIPEKAKISFDHVHNTKEGRRDLRETLLGIHAPSDVLSWAVGGDFNVVGCVEEKIGGRPPSTTDIQEFLNFQLATGLHDAAYTGSQYTWFNGRVGDKRIGSRLDRLLVDQNWAVLPLLTSCEHLSRAESDHAPILIEIKPKVTHISKKFCFPNFWTKHTDFMDIVRQSWQSIHHPNSLTRIGLRLAATRKALSFWSRSAFGDVFQVDKKAEDTVLKAKIEFDSDPTPSSRTFLNESKATLKQRSLIGEAFWRQKARVKWDLQGDRNTSYFHDCVSSRRKHLFIHQLTREDGSIVSDQADIHRKAEQFFEKLFS
ncbi:uncharacterized protein M6B38_300700 [Iris pallida]|uniref:Endonuclease/exonuclease/phosphatase domain-containing protein n=1 Tax=Iris pallida TaxID=29817 RepID=A0AAX6HQT3_IRIPA|nr:uncharacterized protein M6B38_133605 [Iris pallida]KAJ6843192.1 uncharacterized protein M6B38_300700 [Iris pallida]